MKLFVLAGLVAGSLAGATAAHAHGYTTQMSCAQAQSIVQANGAVVLYSSPVIYDRFVAHQGYCSNAGDETTRPAYVPTRDTPRCFVGYRCVQDNRGGGSGG